MTSLHNEPMPPTPAPNIEIPDAREIAIDVAGQAMASRSPAEIANDVIEKTVISIFAQLFLRLMPLGSAAAHYGAGRQSYEACRFTEALGHFSAAITYDPDNIISRFQRACTYSMLGNPEQSNADYTEIIRRDGTYWPAYQNRALNYWTLGDITAADDDLWEARRLAPDNDRHMVLSAISLEMHGQAEAAVEAHTVYLTTHPDSTYSRYRRAGLYFELKQAERALEDYTVLLEYAPKNLSGLRKRGYLYLKAKRYAEAVEDYRRAIMLVPDHADTHFRLARAYQGIKELDAATASYQRCLELDPTIGAAHWSLGDIHSECGRPAEAIAAYTAYIEQQADPDWRGKAQKKIDGLRKVMPA